MQTKKLILTRLDRPLDGCAEFYWVSEKHSTLARHAPEKGQFIRRVGTHCATRNGKDSWFVLNEERRIWMKAKRDHPLVKRCKALKTPAGCLPADDPERLQTWEPLG